jgi:hypothetical protein
MIRLPRISLALTDWHLSLIVGDVGVTVGPHFLSIDKDGDIAHQIISPPAGYSAPLSDVFFQYDSQEGLSYHFAKAPKGV